jgi:hypothetical protein
MADAARSNGGDGGCTTKRGFAYAKRSWFSAKSCCEPDVK